MSSKILLSDIPKKYPKLVKSYEKTGKKVILLNGNVSKGFMYWIQNKIKNKSLICKDPNCPNFGQQFNSIITLNRHNSWHNRKIGSLNDHISEFFLKFLFEHSFFSNNILFGICKDTFQPHPNEYKNIKTKLFNLTHYHLNLGVLEKYNTRSYKINKEKLKEHYGNGELIGKS